MDDSKTAKLTPSLLWLMAIGSGLVVANNYYNQPLLALMAKDFGVSESKISNIAVLTQIGYACGLLFIVPLGDMLNRKRIILIDFAFIIASLMGMALAPSVAWLLPISFLVGFTSVIPQIFVPMAAEMALPEKRSTAIGTVMSGLLIGILLSRVISGIIGDFFGWREMYWTATGAMIVLAVLIAIKLPDITPTFRGSYRELMQSLIDLTKTQPVLRLAAFRGAMGFAAFSAFWTTLVFHMEGPPFQDGPAIVGSFGLVGAAGALAAALVGKLSHRVSAYQIILVSTVIMLASWAVFYWGGYTYVGLIIGIIFIDLGLQSMHIMNQSSFYALNLGANNRLNTVYMVSYFIGGSTGTYLAAHAWKAYGWTGVVAVGTLFTILALIAHLGYDKRINK